MEHILNDTPVRYDNSFALPTGQFKINLYLTDDFLNIEKSTYFCYVVKQITI